MADYTLSVNIKGDSEEFKRALKAAQDAVDGFEQQTSSLAGKLGKLGSSIAGFGAKWSLGITTPITAGVKTAISAASDYEENLNKVDVAFGNSAQAVKDWADTATASFGLSKNQALEATSLFGDMATSMGLTPPAAADMSTSLAGLAGDLASFKNISSDEAMSALSGVFTGETESLKQLGIVMTETNLEEFAAQTGQVYSEMSQAEKVQLRYNYVMAMAANAQGDYARTSDGTANSLRTFQGSVDNLAIAFGQQLLPVFTPIIQSATELINRFAEMDPSMQQLIIKVALFAAALGPVSVAAGGVMKGISGIISTVGKFKSAGSTLMGFVGNVNAIRKSFSGMAGPLTAEQQKIVDFANSAKSSFGKVVSAAKGLKGGIASGVSGLGTTFSGLGTSIATTAKSAGSSLMVMGGAMRTAMAPFLPAIAIFAALAAAIVYLWNTNDEFKNSMMSSWEQIKTSFEPVLQSMSTLITSVIQAIMPAIQQLAGAFAQLIPTITPIITLLAGSFAQILVVIVGVIGQVVQAIAPLIASLVSQLAPIITQIVTSLAPIITQLVGVLAPILTTIGNIITTYIMPAITTIIGIVANVISTIIQIITPIISFIAGVVGNIISVIASIISTVSSVFNKIYSVVSSIMGKVRSFIANVFNKIKSAWNGLTSFVGGIFDGIAGAVQSLVDKVKGFINGVIGGINAAIGLINKIPGVSISKIPKLAHGTDNWQGGFAVMNEGGRGELVNLPNGSQVIPHDVSVKYAKESARANAAAEPLDVYALGAYIVEAVTAQGAQIAGGLEKGVSQIRMVPNDRNMARYIGELGFERG